MTPPLLHLQRSDTGHFVLTEPASQTVVVAEELGDAYARMTATLAEHPPSAAPVVATAGPFERRGTTRVAVIAAALLLPALWVARIAFDVNAAQVVCPSAVTRSQGHPTRVATTPSAHSDREGTEDDEDVDEDDEAPPPPDSPPPRTAVIVGPEAAPPAPAKAEP
ncbi:hypothetical protein [Nannocystis radixulma]|uniref:Uncharacterized protein n=1 Tax=Nannocystis radixulma TaxID=2995305 RepID=A0ABT5B2M4_9BACT|nr:hypothetical protein [Nannocystis radixulma]MDC0667998.1 hypothetical protein [Nannocystis radixulma]